MIADSNGDRSGDTRPLWITGLSPPDSWRSLRQPGYLQLDQVRTPKHCVWGYDRTLKVRNFRSTKVGNFQSQLTPVVGMMLHQDGSSHEWVAGQWWDLIVTMDDATSEVYSGFFVAEEGTMSTFRGLGEVIAENGLFCSLYADRASHYWHTPEAGGGVDKDNPTPVGRALAQLGIELIAAYSPQARGRSERMFGTLQKRLPQELRLAGIATMAEANRFLEELFWPAHNARFARPAADTGSAFVAFAGTLEDILCAQEDRVVAGDNTVRYKNRTLQIPADRHRHHYVKAQVRVHEYPDGHLAVFHGPRCLARYRADGETIDDDDDRLQAA